MLAAVALVAAVADAATLNKRARLRVGPGKETTLLGWVEEGTVVTIEGQSAGWYAVRTPDGQTGFIWREHLRFDGDQAAPPATVAAVAATMPPPPTPRPTVPPPTVAPSPPSPAVAPPPPSPIPDARATPSERSDGNVAGEIERMRSEVARLANAQQELAQKIGRGGREGGAPPPMGSDGSAGAAVLFFGAGTVIGWLVGRFGPGRRERRSRLRL